MTALIVILGIAAAIIAPLLLVSFAVGLEARDEAQREIADCHGIHPIEQCDLAVRQGETAFHTALNTQGE